MPYNASKHEWKILNFWDKEKIFQKSVTTKPEDKRYVFYDGPPFATGLPHYGHIVASLEKDAVPRYQTMRGHRVERVWGWDCHGLPIENLIEKELNLETRQDIEEYGLKEFNQACHKTVMRYAEEWQKTIHRVGRWVDMVNDYKTMDIEYMESVWWVFKQLWERDLIYEGYKAMHICPRCVTPLSNFEVSQNYQTIKDLTVTAKFKVLNAGEKLQLSQADDVYLLAWTTTPWTLPGNVLLAVGKDIEYKIVKKDGSDELYIVAEDRLERVMGDKKYVVRGKKKGSELVGLEYRPLFPYFKDTENAFRVSAADFVSTAEGTGIVHIAPAFGEDDYKVGKREGTGWVQHVDMEGKFTSEVADFAGMEVKPKEDPSRVDVEILKWLAKSDQLFSKEKYEHAYPFCWRCDTPLLNYATSCWFVNTTLFKRELLENNEKIHWTPDHIKYGRFGKWLENVRDWAVSRNRFWGAPLPIWKSDDGEVICVGSVRELNQLSGGNVSDLHKHVVDEIIIEKDGKQYKRIPEVLDCWFESGAMPYAQMHYPFENKEKFEANFPADFIAEAQDQTRGWFYTLHVLATALTRGDRPAIPGKESRPAFKNVIVHGIVLAEDGKKMSKRLKNYPEPDTIMEKYGADAVRYYLISSPVLSGVNLNFSEEGVRDVYNKLCNTLWNVFSFYNMFADQSMSKDTRQPDNVLDKWILAKLNILVRDVTRGMEEYKLNEASRPIMDFVGELSQWYVRRSRDRLKGEDERDRQAAIGTLRRVLLTLSEIMAPFTPFMAEIIYREMVKKESGYPESVHLEKWPEINEILINKKILHQMNRTRKIVELGLSARKEAGIKVRQPLSCIRYQGEELGEQFEDLIAAELNVKRIKHTENIREQADRITKEEAAVKIGLNILIDEQLKQEGLVRELTRAVNQIRKEKGLTVEDKIRLVYRAEESEVKNIFEKYKREIAKTVLADEIVSGEGEKRIKFDDSVIYITVEKVQ